MLAKPVLKIVDLFQIPKILQVLLRLLNHASILTAEELEAAGQVLGPEAVQYPKVRIAERGDSPGFQDERRLGDDLIPHHQPSRKGTSFTWPPQTAGARETVRKG